MPFASIDHSVLHRYTAETCMNGVAYFRKQDLVRVHQLLFVNLVAAARSLPSGIYSQNANEAISKVNWMLENKCNCRLLAGAEQSFQK